MASLLLSSLTSPITATKIAQKVTVKGNNAIIDLMKKELMDILACPVCKGKLELSVKEENEQEIITGSLYCPKCKEHYPIEDSIPNLLPSGQRD